ncbi:MAG: stage II sporulation protein M [Candidatus Aenigmarchaeota archaeon]|nr:stage II sporulation protein M [Candidatus Aenigmarchaeota archaeon]
MVLESLLNPRSAAGKQLDILVVSVMYTFIALFFAYQLFPQESSLLTISMVTIVFVPFFQKLFEEDEAVENSCAKPAGNLLVRHKETMLAFSAFFLGVVVATSFAYIFFPSHSSAFSLQSQTLRSITSGGVTEAGGFAKYFINNSQVMVLVFILSVVFGAGAIFILAWNASVIGVFAGTLVQSLATKGIPPAAAFVYGLPVSLSSIALHGVPEIMAYFVAGLAGGILSVGIIRENIHSNEFRLVLKDAVKLLLVAEFLIVFAAWLEAFF